MSLDREEHIKDLTEKFAAAEAHMKGLEVRNADALTIRLRAEKAEMNVAYDELMDSFWNLESAMNEQPTCPKCGAKRVIPDDCSPDWIHWACDSSLWSGPDAGPICQSERCRIAELTARVKELESLQEHQPH